MYRVYAGYAESESDFQVRKTKWTAVGFQMERDAFVFAMQINAAKRKVGNLCPESVWGIECPDGVFWNRAKVAAMIHLRKQ